ncbi:MAG: hypothetical protein ABSH16_04130 [Sedimentisphaerales bacterium]
MTKKNLTALLLIASYVLTTFIAGCIPEDSLQWNADGSKGIYSKKGALFLVDGNNCSLTKIADKETTALWPAISPDGSLFAYSQIVEVSDFNNALKLLPPAQVKEIMAGVEILRQAILAQDIFNILGNFPSLDDTRNEQHVAWVQRYLVENADPQLADKIGFELIRKTKEKQLSYYQLILSPAADPNNKKIIMTSDRALWRQRFSPDSKLLAWVIDNKTDKSFDAGFDLYVAKISEKSAPVFIAPAIAVTYDFRQDSRAIAYIKPENENFKGRELVLGSLVEKTIIDPNGKFLAEPVKGLPQAYTCSGPSKEYAGVLYYSWMAVSYARNDRMLFSSGKISLPSSKIDTENGSVFCCDTLTGAVSDILPEIALDFTQGNYYLFQLSHDSRRILLPGNKNTLGIYALGPDVENSKVLVDVNESFGEDSPPKLVPQWKGQNQVSCLVSQESHYLTNDPNNPHRRKEIIILDDKGNLVQILSKDWPDELLDF